MFDLSSIISPTGRPDEHHREAGSGCVWLWDQSGEPFRRSGGKYLIYFNTILIYLDLEFKMVEAEVKEEDETAAGDDNDD